MKKHFGPKPESAGAVRKVLRQSLSDFALVEDVVLVASELATNVIRHAQTPFTVELKTTEDLIRLEVSDGSSIIPAMADLASSGGGLQLVGALAKDWDIEPTDNGKTIWVEFAIRNRPDSRIQRARSHQ